MKTIKPRKRFHNFIEEEDNKVLHDIFPDFLKRRRVDDNLVAGRLRYFDHEWSKLTGDPLIHGMVRGYRLPFIHSPPLQIVEDNAFYYDKGLEQEITKLLQIGVLVEVNKREPVFCSRIFAIPKKDGTKRLFFNFKPLNRFLNVELFKMENLSTLRDLTREGDYCAKVDMSQAYYAIPIQRNIRNIWHLFGKIKC